MNKVHLTVRIGKNAQLGDENEIGPGCVIEDGVALGSRNRLWMNVYVGPGTTIGDENQIHMGAVIGHVPQDVAFTGEPSFTKIGSRNVIREYVTIHRGTKPGSETLIGDDNFFMANAHVGHNGHRKKGKVPATAVPGTGGTGIFVGGIRISEQAHLEARPFCRQKARCRYRI